MLEGRWLAPLRRNIIDPLACLRSGSPLRSYWKELERTQFLSQATLREMQWERLTHLLRHAASHNRFYRERFAAAGVDVEKIISVRDFQMIPPLTKEEVRQNTAEMISEGVDRGKLMHMKTGGSTGRALDIFITERCSEQRNACARRHDRWSGWEVGEPVAAVWGNPHLPSGWKERLRNTLLAPVIYLDTMSLGPESVSRFVTEWRRVKPTLLFGHAHSIYMLCRHLKEMRVSDVRPRGIISTSMMLLPHERRFIEEVLGVKVTDRYGCEEVSLIASECEEHHGMHLNIEHLFVEFITETGENAGPGAPGRIVVTDLLNMEMPFIRYEVGDVGVPSSASCPCGRGLPLMASVAGRTADFLRKKNGESVAGISLIENTLTRYPGVDQMQIIQETLDHLTVKMVQGAGFDPAVLQDLTAYFRSVFGTGCNVSYEMEQAIPPEPSGKYRFSICRVKP